MADTIEMLRAEINALHAEIKRLESRINTISNSAPVHFHELDDRLKKLEAKG